MKPLEMLPVIQSLAHALAELAGPLAWPVFALFVTIYFRKEARGLLGRLRKGAGVEFDPPPQQLVLAPEASRASASSALAVAPPALSSPATLVWERNLAEMPIIKSAAPGTDREELLLRLLARSVLMSRFEAIEGSIWKSQMDLLMYLDRLVGGESPGRLKELFYDAAVALYPAVFVNYSFEGYVSFLRNQQLVEIVGESVRITQEGKEYLAWRIEQSRAPKLAG